MSEPVLRPDLSPGTRNKLPKTFNEKHEIGYQVYLAMGSERSFKAVAKKMAMSEATIRNWAMAFEWTERVKKDVENSKISGVGPYLAEINMTRGNGLRVIATIMDTLNGLSDLVKDAMKEKRPLTEEEEKAAVNYRSYLNAIGIKVSNGKELKELIMTIGEILDIHQPGSGGAKMVVKDEVKPQQINVKDGGSVLIIQGLKAEEAKEVFGEMQAPLLRGDNQSHSPIG